MAAEKATGAGANALRDRNWPEVGLQVMEALCRALGEVISHTTVLLVLHDSSKAMGQESREEISSGCS